MIFPEPLLPGRLRQRYKRFLADVELEDGQVVTAHCPNSGSMRSCQGPAWPVMLSHHPSPRRRLAYTWELVHNGQCWIGINTGIPNRLVAEAIRANRIPSLAGATELRPEVRYGENSRIDLLAHFGEQKCYIEVKNVTLVEGDGYYRFPDARTERGEKHLRELTAQVRAGHRAVMCFVIQRSDAQAFAPAHQIDPSYAVALRAAHAAGVEILAWGCQVSPIGVELSAPVPWDLHA